MESEPSPKSAKQPIDSQTIFAALRVALVALYSDEQAARVVVDDAGLVASHIAFSSRAQTNWHNILAEAIHQQRLDPLLKVALSTYGNNPTLLTAYAQYQFLVDHG